MNHCCLCESFGLWSYSESGIECMLVLVSSCSCLAWCSLRMFARTQFLREKYYFKAGLNPLLSISIIIMYKYVDCFCCCKSFRDQSSDSSFLVRVCSSSSHVLPNFSSGWVVRVGVFKIFLQHYILIYIIRGNVLWKFVLNLDLIRHPNKCWCVALRWWFRGYLGCCVSCQKISRFRSGRIPIYPYEIRNW